MILKENYQNYTEEEFNDLLMEIHRAIEDEPDRVLIPLMEHFERITEHPSGSDLFFRPAGGNTGEPGEVLGIVKAWRLANEKEGFKTP
ncbi:bacteriocin immunity protein [Pseudomonas sp. S60]|uniref:bacteriocin immunity protein n=1 Tax=Pseudomonas sp. S60 TaxID=211124 RepID=UPI0019117691|nr:bacteriocin immunity protein [Pseudomonas sp. S60]MBK5012657.1 bacteriocin immunity protein [Pseudomonas sp. S60]